MADTSPPPSPSATSSRTSNAAASLQQNAQRARLLKLKEEHDDFYCLCLGHQNLQAQIYDFYLDLPPYLIKRILACLFPLNKLLRLLLIYCLFYHTIWWMPNSASNYLAINYKNINSKAFFILIYINFYDLIVNQLLIRTVAFNLLKLIHFSTVPRIKYFLNLSELFIHAFVNLINFYYLKNVANLSNQYMALIFVPHFCLFLYQQFDLTFVVLNRVVFTNQPMPPNLNELYSFETMSSSVLSPSGTVDEFNYILSDLDNLNNNNNTNTNTSSAATSQKSSSAANQNTLIFRDCSNMSISSFLNQNFPLPSMLTAKGKLFYAKNLKKYSNLQASNVSTTASADASQTVKLIKQSMLKTRMARNKLFYFLNSPICFLSTFFHDLSGMFRASGSSMHKRVWSRLTSVAKGVRFDVKKRNTFNLKNEMVSHVEHKCHRDAFGIREETEYFKYEFNNRLRDVMIKTLESTYFVFVITRLLVPPQVNIREWDYVTFMTLATLNTFLSHWLCYMPLSFLISYRRNAQHLGEWREQSIDSDSLGQAASATIATENSAKSIQLPADVSRWLNTKLYFNGERIYHLGKIYAVKSDFCVSIPGNRFHRSFYRFFSNSRRIIAWLLFLKFVYLILLFVLLFGNGRWYAIMINIVEIVLNSPLLFILFRDFLITCSSNFNSSSKTKAS